MEPGRCVADLIREGKSAAKIGKCNLRKQRNCGERTERMVKIVLTTQEEGLGQAYGARKMCG